MNIDPRVWLWLTGLFTTTSISFSVSTRFEIVVFTSSWRPKNFDVMWGDFDGWRYVLKTTRSNESSSSLSIVQCNVMISMCNIHVVHNNHRITPPGFILHMYLVNSVKEKVYIVKRIIRWQWITQVMQVWLKQNWK